MIVSYRILLSKDLFKIWAKCFNSPFSIENAEYKYQFSLAIPKFRYQYFSIKRNGKISKINRVHRNRLRSVSPGDIYLRHYSIRKLNAERFRQYKSSGELVALPGKRMAHKYKRIFIKVMLPYIIRHKSPSYYFSCVPLYIVCCCCCYSEMVGSKGRKRKSEGGRGRLISHLTRLLSQLPAFCSISNMRKKSLGRR